MYLNNGNRNQNDFYQLRKTMFIDDRIMDNKKEGGHMAVILYMGIEDKISLSKSKFEKEGNANYINANGQYFCCFPEKDAKQELRITSDVYKKRKAFLKKIGLIDYPEQAEKRDGVASQITYTAWDSWVKQNGLYSDGEWIIEPSKEDFYNPADIVKVQPEVGKPKIVEPTKAEIASYNIVMKDVKEIAKKFIDTKRWDVLLDIVAQHLGEGKRFAEASIEDLPKLESAYSDMQKVFEYEEMPNY
jgi:hypothetical protein